MVISNDPRISIALERRQSFILLLWKLYSLCTGNDEAVNFPHDMNLARRHRVTCIQA